MRNLLLSVLVLIPTLAFAAEPSTTITCTRGTSGEPDFVFFQMTNSRDADSGVVAIINQSQFNGSNENDYFNPRLPNEFGGWTADKSTVFFTNNGLELKLTGIPTRIQGKRLNVQKMFENTPRRARVIKFTGMLDANVGLSSASDIAIRCELVVNEGSAG